MRAVCCSRKQQEPISFQKNIFSLTWFERDNTRSQQLLYMRSCCCIHVELFQRGGTQNSFIWFNKISPRSSNLNKHFSSCSVSTNYHVHPYCCKHVELCEEWFSHIYRKVRCIIYNVYLYCYYNISRPSMWGVNAQRSAS